MQVVILCTIRDLDLIRSLVDWKLLIRSVACMVDADLVPCSIIFHGNESLEKPMTPVMHAFVITSAETSTSIDMRPRKVEAGPPRGGFSFRAQARRSPAMATTITARGRRGGDGLLVAHPAAGSLSRRSARVWRWGNSGGDEPYYRASNPTSTL